MSDSIKEKLEGIVSKALNSLEIVSTPDALNEIRVNVLGKKGELKELMKSMKDVAPEDRPKVGQMVNETREAIEAKLNEAKRLMEEKEMELKLATETIDRRHSSCKEECDRTQTSEYHRSGRTRENLRRHGIRGHRGTGSRVG